jgi:hypothetical protein
MGLLTPKKNKDDKKSNTKKAGPDSKFIKKPEKASSFVKKQGTPGAKRGS